MKVKKDKSIPAVIFGTLYLLIYIILLNINPEYHLAWIMLMFSPFLLIWMVLRVLRHGTASSRTFDRHFYGDVDF
jgi:hypothetical protein